MYHLIKIYSIIVLFRLFYHPIKTCSIITQRLVLSQHKDLLFHHLINISLLSQKDMFYHHKKHILPLSHKDFSTITKRHILPSSHKSLFNYHIKTCLSSHKD